MTSTDCQHIILSLVRALWGEIWPSYRAVMCRASGHMAFDIEIVVDGEVTSDMAESVSCVEAEVIADLPPDAAVTSRLIRLDAPAQIVIGDAWLVFLRKEF